MTQYNDENLTFVIKSVITYSNITFVTIFMTLYERYKNKSSSLLNLWQYCTTMHICHRHMMLYIFLKNITIYVSSRDTSLRIGPSATSLLYCIKHKFSCFLRSMISIVVYFKKTSLLSLCLVYNALVFFMIALSSFLSSFSNVLFVDSIQVRNGKAG